MAKPTICLVMIVKNESKVIERCIDSVKDHINHWVIVDTGSTDGTQDIIKEKMKSLGIEGELHERPWLNYGHNRAESMELSKGKCDYRLVIDADDVLEVTDPTCFDVLDLDSYKLIIKLGNLTYYRTQMMKSDQDWTYEGVIHEYAKAPEGLSVKEGIIGGACMVASVSGDTRELKGPDKYYADALVLEKELVTNKELSEGLKTRYQFYLAQSYRDAGMMERALDAYQKRAAMGGWPEEVYISMYMSCKIKRAMNVEENELINSYLQAWEFRPFRLEAIYDLIRYLVEKKRYFLAFSFAHICLKMQPCEDILFVEEEIWRWRMVDEYSVLAYFTGNIKDALNSCESIMQSEYYSNIPEEERKRIEANCETFKKTLGMQESVEA
jgi:glycosyltransferase involved in cell wall biosynthesis